MVIKFKAQIPLKISKLYRFVLATCKTEWDILYYLYSQTSQFELNKASKRVRKSKQMHEQWGMRIRNKNAPLAYARHST